MAFRHIDDSRLVRGVLAGRRDDFAALVDRYYQSAYAIAYSRCGNRPDAQDITQEAFLRAFTGMDSLRDPVLFAPWLMGIVRNTAASLARSIAQQRKHESQSGERAADSKIDDSDLHEILRRTLRELSEEERDVLVMHYFTGLSTREIGMTLGISRENAKKRLQRARASLSERLLAEIGPALTADSPNATERKRQIMGIIASAEVTWMTGSSTMANTVGAALPWKLLFGGALAVITAIAILTIKAPAGNPVVANVQMRVEPVSDAAAPSAALSGAASSAIKATERTTNGTTTAQNAEPTDAMLVCEVVDAAGNPVPNVTVELRQRPRASGPMTTQEEASRTARTDDRGWAIFDNLPKASHSMMIRTSDAIGFAVELPQPYAMVRVALKPAATVGGVVHDASGSPVVGAVVFPFRFKKGIYKNYSPTTEIAVRTGPDGRYAITLPVDSDCTLCIQANGFATMLAPYTVSEVALSRGETAAIRVFQSDGSTPLANTTVRVVDARNRFDVVTGVTDSAGNMALAGLNTAEYIYYVDDPALMPSANDRSFPIEAHGKNEFEIAMKPRVSLSGKVLDVEKNIGVPNCTVEARQSFSGNEILHAVTTGLDGNFVVTGLFSGRVEVRIQELPAGYASDERNPDRPEWARADTNATSTVLKLHNELDYGGEVTGRVVDGDGRNIHRAFVRAMGAMGSTITVRTNNEGVFRFKSIPVTDNLRFCAFLPGQASGPTSKQIVTADGLHDVVLELKPTGTISGRVIVDSGEPVPDTVFVSFVDFLRMGAATPIRSYLFESNRFLLSEVPAGEHGLVVDAEANYPTSGIRVPVATVDLTPGGRIDNLELPVRGARQRIAMEQSVVNQEPDEWKIAGHVVSTSGEPVTEFAVSTNHARLAPQTAHHDSGRFEREANSGPSVVLIFTAPGYREYRQTIRREDARDGATDFEVKITPGCVVNGVVRDGNGRPVQGARIVANAVPMSDDIERSVTPKTDAGGRFVFDTLEEGPATIYAVHPAFAIASAPVTASTLHPQEIVITLRNGGRIEGRVTSNGRPVSKPRLSYFVEPFQAHQKLGEGNADGTFAIEHLTPGVAHVSVFLPDPTSQTGRDRSQRHDVTVTDDETAHLDVVFGPTGSRIEGRITYPHGTMRSVQVRVSIYRDGILEQCPSDTNDRVDENGNYRTAELPAGEAELHITVRIDEQVLRRTVRVSIPENSTITQDIVIAGNSRIAGTVSGLEKDERYFVVVVPGDSADAQSPEFSSNELMKDSVAWVSADTPEFRIEGLDAGTYTIRVSSSMPQAEQRRFDAKVVTLADGDEQDLGFEFR